MIYANLKISGNPISNAGWQTLLTIGEANFVLEDDNFGISAPEFYSFKIENSRVIYVLHKTNVSSIGAGRNGSLKIAISIPRGYKLLNTNPYSLLCELTNEFIKKYMIQRIEKYEFLPSSVSINEADFTTILHKYELVESKGAYRPKDIEAKEIGKLVLSTDKIESLLRDVQYKEFKSYSNIVVSTIGIPTPALSNIIVPRIPTYSIKQEGYNTALATNISEKINYKANVEPAKAQFYENTIYEFSIKELLEGKIFEGITFDNENEEININIQPKYKPIKYYVKLVGDEQKISKTRFTAKISFQSIELNYENKYSFVINADNSRISKDSFIIKADSPNVTTINQSLEFQNDGSRLLTVKVVFSTISELGNKTSTSSNTNNKIKSDQPDNQHNGHIKLTITINNTAFLNGQPIVLHLRNSETIGKDSVNIMLIQQPIYPRDNQATVCISKDWDKENIYGYIENKSGERINLSFSGSDHTFLKIGKEVEATATEIANTTLIDKIKKISIPILIALIVIALFFGGFAAGILLKNNPNPKTEKSEEQAANTNNNKNKESNTSQPNIPVVQQAEPDYTAYINAFKKWNSTLNKDDVTFTEIDNINSEFENKKKSDSIFNKYLQSDPSNIEVENSSYPPSFFTTKIATYKRAANWVRAKKYDEIKNENNKMSKYIKMKPYHKQYMEIISVGTYNNNKLNKYDNIKASEIEDLFKDNKKKFKSFKDLETQLK